MTFVSKILLYNSSLFQFNRGATNLIQRLSLREKHHMRSSYSRSNIVSQENTLNTDLSFSYNKNRFKNSSYGVNKLQKVDLVEITQNAHNLPVGLLIATFQKLRYIYYSNKGNPKFHKEFNYVTKSRAFHDFCSLLEKELPKLQPSHLSCLIDLVNFKISPKSAIMKKIFALILDNIHFFPPIDLLEFYCQLKEKHFFDVPECTAILEACEKYFEKHLEGEISYYNDFKNMTCLISDEILPLNARKILLERCLSLIESINYKLPFIPSFFTVAFNEPFLPFYQAKLIHNFKLILETHKAPRVQHIFSKVYRNIVNKYDYVYDAEICQMLVDNIASIFTDYTFIKTISHLCDIGYYDREATEKVLDLLISVNPERYSPKLISCLVSVLVDTSSHEMNFPHWDKVKNQLESTSLTVLTRLKFLDETYEWCEFLTFLKCDTTPLFSRIFQNYASSTEIKESSRSVLRLHHVCKKYFPDSDLGLDKKLLASCLQSSVYKKNFYVDACVDKFFGSSNYVLKNCHTSDYHFLPIVAVLGPDNKPIDLSSYQTTEVNELHKKSFSVIVNIDHIQRPPGSKVLAFLEYPSLRPFKFRNAPITSGYLKMFLKPYEGVDFNIILLPLRYFSLEEDEKLKYLSSEVNKIIESSETKTVRNEIS